MRQSNNVDLKHGLFLKVFVVLISCGVVIQLYIMSSIGTKGEELSLIKNSQNTIRVENEILKAKVMALKSNQAVLDGLNNHVEVIIKPINFLDPEVAQISAQN
jgi:hypothetical protein